MLRDHRDRGVEPDAGLTLIELVLAAALTVLVGTVLVGLFGVTQKTAASVGSTTRATTAAQLASQTIDRTVRNASSIDVTAIGSDLLLRAATVSGSASASWRCSAIYYSASDNTIRLSGSTSPIAAPASTITQRSWTLLASGVTVVPAVGVVPSPPVFAVVAASTPATGSQTVSYAFRVQDGASPAVAMQGSASHLAVQAGGLSCF